MSVEEELKFENELKTASADPVGFFTQNFGKYDKNQLSSLLGYFLSNSNDIGLLKETINQINILRHEKNIDDLIDFLMTRSFNGIIENNEVVNLKTLCIKAISNFKDKKCIPALLYCLNDKSANYKMRFQSAVALGKIGDKNAVESLINVVADEEEKSVYVRESAAVALGMIGDMRAIDPFLTILEAKRNFLDKFTFLKERVIEALGKISITGNGRVLEAFKNALDDDSAQVRINAIECLMNSGHEEAYDLIKKMLFDIDEEVIKNAVIALYNLKGKDVLYEILNDSSLPKAARNEADELRFEFEEEDENEE